jgi:hypothetical protein
MSQDRQTIPLSVGVPVTLKGRQMPMPYDLGERGVILLAGMKLSRPQLKTLGSNHRIARSSTCGLISHTAEAMASLGESTHDESIRIEQLVND